MAYFLGRFLVEYSPASRSWLCFVGGKPSCAVNDGRCRSASLPSGLGSGTKDQAATARG